MLIRRLQAELRTEEMKLVLLKKIRQTQILAAQQQQQQQQMQLQQQMNLTITPSIDIKTGWLRRYIRIVTCILNFTIIPVIGSSLSINSKQPHPAHSSPLQQTSGNSSSHGKSSNKNNATLSPLPRNSSTSHHNSRNMTGLPSGNPMHAQQGRGSNSNNLLPQQHQLLRERAAGNDIKLNCLC